MTVCFLPSPSLTFISHNSLQEKTTNGVIMDVSGHGGCIQLKVDPDNNSQGLIWAVHPPNRSAEPGLTQGKFGRS